jgi:pyruvate dehydrogenase E1 component beta subunit
MVLRTQGGASGNGAAQHSQSLEAWLTHIPGLKVVMPSCAADAAGLLLSAIEDPNPVVFVENKSLYFKRQLVPAEPQPVPIGVARTLRHGDDLTIIATSRMVGESLVAAERLAADGIEAELIDLRSLVPLDREAISQSVQRTGRAVVAHEAVTIGGFGGEVAAVVQDLAFDCLEAPIQRVGAPFMPVPLSPSLEDAYRPGADDVYAAAQVVIEWDQPVAAE